MVFLNKIRKRYYIVQKPFYIVWIALCILFAPNLLLAGEKQEAPFVFLGDVPLVAERLQSEMLPLYQEIEKIAGFSVPPAERKAITVYFVSFKESDMREYPLLEQLKQEWLRAYPEAGDEGDFSKNIGFHYDGTSIIQLAPRTFENYYTNDPWGRKTIPTGMGMYILAHETLHILYERNGIAGILHHCLFVEHGITRQVAEYLDDRKLANAFVLRHQLIRAEEQACELDKKRYPKVEAYFEG